MSVDFDEMIKQERETDLFAAIELKEYVKSKLEESFQQVKSDTTINPANTPTNLGFVQGVFYSLEQQNVVESQLKSLLEESKIQISKLDVKYCLESLRINYTSGFIPACRYLLDQPISVIPKPWPFKRSKIN